VTDACRGEPLAGDDLGYGLVCCREKMSQPPGPVAARRLPEQASKALFYALSVVSRSSQPRD
ncbi:MAG: hypothetical protein WAL09_17495, partial [Pseudolabrys sp.]